MDEQSWPKIHGIARDAKYVANALAARTGAAVVREARE
jgi:hypothetical protein